MKTRALPVLLFPLLWIATQSGAAVLRLDDSASPHSRVPARIVQGDDGRSLANARGNASITLKFGAVD